MEIRAAGKSAHRNKDKLAILFDEWTACQGVWKESHLFIQLSHNKTHRKIGRRVWLTWGELVKKFGDVESAKYIWEAKLSDDDGSQVRPNPDCPKVKESCKQRIYELFCFERSRI